MKIEIVNYTDENGLAQGKWIEYYKNGNIHKKAFYKDGKLDGEYIRYYYGVGMELNVVYEDGKHEGKCRPWHSERANIEIKDFYKNGYKEEK
jgi:antitoxin component YwqK of YwqJK toxin-antitoxin module